MPFSEYTEYLKNKEEEFESVCKRCGRCCGADNDPCRNLEKAPDGRYFCREYSDRLKQQRTARGNSFHCVSIREHMKKGFLPPGCAYGKRSNAL